MYKCTVICCNILYYSHYFWCSGAGHYPRHTHMLDHLGDAQKKENSKFITSYESVENDSPLWRADWGIKQWIPYLLGTFNATLLST